MTPESFLILCLVVLALIVVVCLGLGMALLWLRALLNLALGYNTPGERIQFSLMMLLLTPCLGIAVGTCWCLWPYLHM